MVRNKGKYAFRQYIRDKPTKWGMKLWILADSLSGYTYDFDIYLGKQDNGPFGLAYGGGDEVKGDMRWIRDGQLLTVQWRDNKTISLMSTIHDANDSVTAKRRTKTNVIHTYIKQCYS
ncbi:piggyBac transposable element-derived protein 3 [Biomphalaria pfeifferi]|uniref:PiggyBac transposable element-derived protein 3 n=1 Tax=Biomphalaria pfeifferi TaxID=112525 RepID=A0AAD8FIK9_BIOPF|nr:piggyBac transposable element-derived protein 3 [Biomphalaria pfeifferi]